MVDENKKLDEELQEEVVEEGGASEEKPVQEEKAEEVKEEPKENEELKRLKDSYVRLQADFQNFRNRSDRERSNILKNANEKLIGKILPVVDNLERALKEEKDHDPFFEGVNMIYQELQNILKLEGLTEIESDGQKFDVNMHHALFMEDSETVESGYIIETFQKGYKLHDKILRPAMVKVAK